MKSGNFSRAVALALAASTAAAAFAAETDNWKIDANFDLYYLKDLNHPGTGFLNGGRAYDIFNKSPHFAAFELGMNRKATRDMPLGINIDLIFGKNADINNSFEPAGPRRYRNIRQAFLDWTSGDQRVNLAFGKFDSWMGFETITSGDNWNYYRGLNYTFLQPRYFFGGKVGFNLNDRTDIGLYAVNGYNEVKDSNSEMGFGGHVGFKSGNWGLRLGGYAGEEGRDAMGSRSGIGIFGEKADVSMLDAVLTFKPNDRWDFGINATSVDLEIDDEDFDTNAMGWSIYARYKMNDRWNLGARIEQMEDDDSFFLLSRFGSGLEVRPGTDGTGFGSTKLESATINFDYSASEKSWLRLEFRWDKADRDLWQSDDGVKDSRSTYSLSYFFRF
jgi:hypothetical protein